MRLPENYYEGYDRPYQSSHSMLLLEDMLETKIKKGDVQIWRKEISYSDAQKGKVAFTEMQTWLERYPQSKAFAVFVGIPSPTGREDAGHAVALYIDVKNATIHYQDPHGLPMPKPLLAGLQDSFEGFTIYNHRIVQQPRGDGSCAPLTIHNLVGFAHGEMPLHAPDIVKIRQAHLPFLLQIIRDDNLISGFIGFDIERQAKTPVKRPIATPAEISAFWAHPYPHVAPIKIEGAPPPPTLYIPSHRPGIRTSLSKDPLNSDPSPSS